MSELASFGEWVRRCRRALDLTREALAQQVGCAVVTIRKIEADERRPSRQVAERLAECLQIPAEQRAVFLQAARIARAADRLAKPPTHDQPFRPVQSEIGTDPAHEVRRTNLPIPLTQLVGRERDLAALGELLGHRDLRLLNLTGAGGAGKTRLALQLAAEQLACYAHGVWFVDLAPLRDPTLVIPAILQALGLKEVGGGRPPLQQVQDFIRDKQLLLMLDNFEHLLEAAPLLIQLLAAAPLLTVLVTSRTALRLRGEHEYTVPPLELPDRAQIAPLEDLAQYPAIELFIQRAQAVQTTFQLISANAPAVVEICHRLDGLPLAIELAAARSRLFSPQALLQRLDSRLTILTGGARDFPSRQQTIRSTIDWSYNLLATGEKRLFMRLGVFVGGCTLQAVEAICISLGDAGSDVVDGLMSLFDKSLLGRAELESGEPLFRMLETIREYALEKLHESGELVPLRTAHCVYYAGLAVAAEPHLTGSHQAVWLAHLEHAHDNLRAALRWALEQGDGLSALQLAGGLGKFWEVRGHWSEGRLWLGQALAANTQPSPATEGAAGTQPWLARTLWWAGALAWRQCDYEQAHQQLEQSLAIHRALGASDHLTDVLSTLGGVAFEQGRYADAQVLYEECLAVRRAFGSRERIGDSLFCVGLVAIHQQAYPTARRYLEESLALLRDAGYAYGSSFPLNSLGNLANLQGDYQAAQTCYDECLSIRRELGDKRGVAAVLCDIANMRIRQQDLAAARQLYEESLVSFRALSNQRGIAYALSGLARVNLAQGHPMVAAELLSGAEALLAQMHARIDEPEHSDKVRAITEVRAQLSDGQFQAAWERGKTVRLEELISLAQNPLSA